MKISQELFELSWLQYIPHRQTDRQKDRQIHQKSDHITCTHNYDRGNESKVFSLLYGTQTGKRNVKLSKRILSWASCRKSIITDSKVFSLFYGTQTRKTNVKLSKSILKLSLLAQINNYRIKSLQPTLWNTDKKEECKTIKQHFEVELIARNQC